MAASLRAQGQRQAGVAGWGSFSYPTNFVADFLYHKHRIIVIDFHKSLQHIFLKQGGMGQRTFGFLLLKIFGWFRLPFLEPFSCLKVYS